MKPISEKYHPAAIGTTIGLHLLLLLLLWFWLVSFTIPVKENQGMQINFGQMETGLGEEAPSAQEEAQPPVVEEQSEQETEVQPAAADQSVPEPIAQQESQTVNDIEAPSLPKEELDKKEDLEKENEVKEETKPKEQKEEPKVDENALFGNNSNSNDNNATTQGNDRPGGDMGVDDERVNNNQSSDLYTPSDNIGMGETGDYSWELTGRSALAKETVKDKSQREGKIRVKIKVGADGTVISATAVSTGTTISNDALRKKAEAAAMKWRFNADPKAPPVQTGYLNYVFKVQ